MNPRPALAIPVLLVGALVLPALTPTAESATEVRHYLDADQIGTTGDDVAIDVDAADPGSEPPFVASAGLVDGQLPGQTHAGGADAYVRLTDADGRTWFTTQLGGPGHDSAEAVSVDGSVVVAGGRTAGGLAGPAAGGEDGWLRAFDTEGNTLWTHALGSAGEDHVLDVAIANGHVYAAGMLDADVRVWKFTMDGTLVWSADPGGAGPFEDDRYQVTALEVVGDQVVVAEWFAVSWDESYYKIASLDDLTGERSWEYKGGPHVPTALASDGTYLYVTSWTDDYDLVEVPYPVLKSFTLDGEYRWSVGAYFNNGYDPSYPVEVEASGSSLLVISDDWGKNHDVLSAISPYGRLRWTRRLPPGFSSTSGAFGEVGFYVSGGTSDTLQGTNAGGSDAAVARTVTFQPDAQARRPRRPMVGNDWYSARHQTLGVPVSGVRTSRALLVAQNDGEVAQRLRLKSCGDHDGYTFRYRRGTANVTGDVVAGRHRSPLLDPQARDQITVAITPTRRAAVRTRCVFTVISPTVGERDRFTLVVRRR